MDFSTPSLTWSAGIIALIDLIVRFTALLVIPRNRKPTSGMAWLLVIFFLPLVGVPLFLLIGSNRLPKSRRVKHRQINAMIRKFVEGTAAGRLTETDPDAPEWLDGVAELNRTLGSLPMTRGNRVSLIPGYEDAITQMAQAIDAAESSVEAEFYILALDRTTRPFFDALERAKGRGVKVRVLADYWASKHAVGAKQTFNHLDALGIEWHWMLPLQPFRGEYQRPDLRNHRKILIVDERIGYMGSQNVVDSSYNKRKNLRRGLHWLDLMARIEGPGVSALRAVFASDWYLETDELLTQDALPALEQKGASSCQVVPSGPGFASENNLQLFLALLYNAQERIIITSPYFVPDDSMLYALTAATARGVHVELFVSEIGDQFWVYHAQRSYYEALLKAGVVIRMYRPPTILHAKHFTIDDETAVLGSSNMDMRSFSLNFEVSMLVYDRAFVARLREIEADYRAKSRELTLEEWHAQPLPKRLLDNLARLTSALQ